MARNQQPSWVSDLQYPAKGIGDLNDLSFKKLVGEASKWTLSIKSGWFYLEDEDFFYRLEGSRTYTSLPASAQSLTSTAGYNIGWGPILVSNGTDSYSPVGTHLSPANAITWTASGSNGLYYYNIPSYQTLVAVRDLTNIPMVAVKSLSTLTHTKLYYLDTTLNRVYVLSSSSPDNNLFLDLLVQNHSILNRELVWVTDGLVHLSNYPAKNTTIYRGTTSSAVGTVTGAFEPDLGSEGEWLVATYYLENSYAVISNSRVDVYSSDINNVTIRNETSSPANDKIVFPANDSDKKIDFNPINPDSYGPGYLIMSSDALTPGTAKRILVKADKTSFCPDWGEEVNVRIQVLDINDLPIPQKPLYLDWVGNQENTFDTTMTSKQGEVLLRISHSSTVTVTASADGISGYVSVGAVDESDFLDSNLITDGRTSFVVLNDKDSKGNLVSYCNAHQLDGIPKTQDVTIRAKGGTSFYLNNQDYKQTMLISCTITPQHPTGISPEFGILPVKGDLLNATTTNGQSKIIEVVDV